MSERDDCGTEAVMSEYAELAAYLEQRIAGSEDAATVIFAGLVDGGFMQKAIQLLKKADAEKRSLRDEFAGQASASMLERPYEHNKNYERVAKAAYEMADYMLAARRPETK